MKRVISKSFSQKATYICQDCGHCQKVIEVFTEEGVFVGSGANWCDSCEDGLPLRKPALQDEAIKNAAVDIWFSIRKFNGKPDQVNFLGYI